MFSIIFSESKEFYTRLDEAIKRGPVTIQFRSERPDKNAKLWARLRQCKNWDALEQEFKKIQEGKDSDLKKVISPVFTGALTGLEIALIAWVATLLAGLVFYGVYKGCTVKLKVKNDEIGSADLEIGKS